MLSLICIVFLLYNTGALPLEVNSSNATFDVEPLIDGIGEQHLRDAPSLATAVVNTQVLTMFNYHGSQIYIYGAVSNEIENAHKPRKWVFYFVPIMMPAIRNGSNDEWVFAVKNEVRIQLMLSNDDVEELARKAIIKKYDSEDSQYSDYWTVAPLMIDSLMAYIVRGTNSPVEGVHPYKAVHPNQLTMQFRFYCSFEALAREMVEKIIDDVYEIEVGFYFAGFKQVTTNLISITSDQLKSVLSKTIADGGTKNPQFIHRNQGSTFVSKYVTNVKKMIYMENLNTNVSSLSAGLEDQFISLLQQGMAFSQEAKIDAKVYDQVWSGSDLNPDRITSELKKLFTYNQTETERHNYSDSFFDFNEAYAQSSSGSGGGGVSIFGLGSASGGGASSSSSSGHLSLSTESTVSQTDIQHYLTQESIETAWTGEKFIPKSFSVYKLTDITDRLQVAILAKQLIAEKANGAIVRVINTRTVDLSMPNRVPSGLIGEIKMYAGNSSHLPRAWIFCHGQAVSRVEYHRLFAAIGETFGIGDRNMTFTIPDFRGRFPLGLDPRQNEKPGLRNGGSRTQTLSIAQMPAHEHGHGTLGTTNAGSHGHYVNDPGHNHGGWTSTQPGGGGGYNLKGNGRGHFDDGNSHAHSIPTGRTGISLSHDGAHSHSVTGSTAQTGSGQSFSIMPPHQTMDYIIFTGIQ